MHLLSKILQGVVATALVSLVSLPARASEQFPAALQEAAGMPCAPSCVVCHGVDPGTLATFMNKDLGKDIFAKGANSPDAGKLKTAWQAYAADAANAATVTALKSGLDPETGADLCSDANKVAYGCGARIAKDEPRDDWSALLFVAGAMGFGALLCRTKRR